MRLRIPLFSLPRLWGFAVVMLPAAASMRTRLETPDLAFHIRAGQIMEATRSFIRTDSFSFTAAGDPWTNQPWGAQVILAGVYDLGAWFLLALLRGLLIGLIFLLVYAGSRRAGASRRISAALTVGAMFLSLTNLALRPQLGAILLFALSTWLLVQRHNRPRLLWWFPLLVLVWTQIHGSFFLPLALLAIATLQDLEERRPDPFRPALIALASLPFTLIGPLGAGLWTYAVELSTNELIADLVTEWAPPTVRTFTGAMFFGSIALVIAFLARWRTSVPWTTLLGMGFFISLGLVAERGVVWWALGAPYLFAPFLARSHPHEELEPRRILNDAFAVFIALLMVAFVPWHNDPARMLNHAPLDLTQRLEQELEPGESFFNAQVWGSWFNLSLPDNPVMVDSRIELFPREVWRDYLSVSFAQEGWDDTLDRYDIDTIVAEHDQQEDLLRVIRGHRDWELTYEDDEGVIFLRRRGR